MSVPESDVWAGDVAVVVARYLEFVAARCRPNTVVATAQVPQPIVYVAAGGGFAWTANESAPKGDNRCVSLQYHT